MSTPTADEPEFDRIPAVPVSPAPFPAASTLGLQVQYPAAGTAVVTVRGDVDDATLARFAELLRHRLASLLEVLILDLSAVEFLSVSGVELLRGLLDRAPSRGIRPEVVACTRPVRRALRAAGLDERLPCHSSVVEALAAATQAPSAGARTPAVLPRPRHSTGGPLEKGPTS